MDKQNNYEILVLNALKRASIKVVKDAIKNNYNIPYWIDGKVEYQIPTLPIIEQSHEKGNMV